MKISIQHVLCGLIFVCMRITPMHGQKVISDRPDQTESAFTVPPNFVQLECGASVKWTESFSSGTERELVLPTALIRVGVLPSLELRVMHQLTQWKSNSAWVENSPMSGTDDLELGLKWQVLNKKTQMALLSHFSVNTGTESAGEWRSINKWCISHNLESDWSIGYNLGFDLIGGSMEYTYAFSVGKAIDSKVAWYVEPYGTLDENGVFYGNIDAGFMWLVNERFQIDWSFGIGKKQRMNYSALGFSWLMGGGEAK